MKRWRFRRCRWGGRGEEEEDVEVRRRRRGGVEEMDELSSRG